MTIGTNYCYTLVILTQIATILVASTTIRISNVFEENLFTYTTVGALSVLELIILSLNHYCKFLTTFSRWDTGC